VGLRAGLDAMQKRKVNHRGILKSELICPSTSLNLHVHELCSECVRPSVHSLVKTKRRELCRVDQKNLGLV
jgi:hypothetical protein